MKKFTKDYVIGLIETCLFFGGIMAVICLICCRDDPLKENIYRVLGVMLCTALYMLLPYILILISYIFCAISNLFKKNNK